MLALDYALAGIGLGSIAALSGIGLLVTYRATGVFNVAHGAIAMITAYVLWEAVDVWQVPVGVAAAVAVLGFAPALGLLAERAVFRPLQRAGASPARSLVAALGLLVLLVGIAYTVWGPQAQHAPSLLPTQALHAGSVTVRLDVLIDLVIVVTSAVLLGTVATRTHLGTQIRAVVDRRELAELARVDADRVAMLGWAVGAGFAGLTGVLLAPQLSLNPIGLTLVVLETFALPVIANLVSFPAAVVAGIAIGVSSSEMNLVTFGSQAVQQLWNAAQANLFVVALLLALLIRNRLGEVGGDAGEARALSTRRMTIVAADRRALGYGLATVLLVAPLAFPVESLRNAQEVPAFAVIFVSLVAVTGYSGQISLGQAGYAGLGALFFAIFSNSAPELVALLWGVVAAGIVGFLTGYPAIRRRGLFLALTTFAVGAAVSRFVFQQPAATAGLAVRRPELFGLSLAGDRAFYVFELACLVVALLVVRNLRTGRLGRALVAIRDNEDGARAVGINLPVLKVFIFTVSSALAGLGGALLVQTRLAFDPSAFDPLISMFWFTAVVVFGADSAAGAVLAAGFVVMVNTLADDATAYAVPIGVLALLLGRVPGGAVEIVRRTTTWVVTPPALLRRFGAALPQPAPAPRLSTRGRELLARAHGHADEGVRP